MYFTVKVSMMEGMLGASYHMSFQLTLREYYVLPHFRSISIVSAFLSFSGFCLLSMARYASSSNIDLESNSL